MEVEDSAVPDLVSQGYTAPLPVPSGMPQTWTPAPAPLGDLPYQSNYDPTSDPNATFGAGGGMPAGTRYLEPPVVQGGQQLSTSTTKQPAGTPSLGGPKPAFNPRPILPQGPPVQVGGKGIPGKPVGAVPGDLKQHGGFYFQPEYLQDLNDAFAEGRIDEKTYEKLLDKYQNSSVGLQAQKFALGTAQLDAQADAQRLMAKQEAGQSWVEGLVMGDAARRAKATAKEMDQQRALIRSQVAKDEELLRRSIDEYKAMNENPSQHWSRASFGGKLVGGIAAAMGAFGAALARTPNFALEIMNKQIDDEMQAQRRNIEKAGSNIEAQKGILAQMYLKLGDVDKAEAAARAQIYDGLQMDLAAMRKNYPAKVYQERADAANAMLEQQKSAAILDYKMQAQLAAEESARQEALRKMGAANAAAARQRKDMEKMMDPFGGLNWVPSSKYKKSDFYIPGIGFAPDNDTRKSLAERAARDRVVQGNLQKLADLAQDINTVDAATGKIYQDNEKLAAYNALRQNTIRLGSMSLGQGAVTEGEASAWEESIPDASKLMQSKEHAVAGLQASANMFSGMIMPYYEANGVQPGYKRGKWDNEKGEWKEEVTLIPTTPKRAERELKKAAETAGYDYVE